MVLTWRRLREKREQGREAQIASVMRLIEQYPCVDVFMGMPSRLQLWQAKHYPLCDGVLIIFEKQKER